MWGCFSDNQDYTVDLRPIKVPIFLLASNSTGRGSDVFWKFSIWLALCTVILAPIYTEAKGGGAGKGDY